MSLAIPRTRTAFTPGWIKNDLWRRARAIPSVDIRFAESRSLVDEITGRSLVTFTRASSATFTDREGLPRIAANDVPRFDHNLITGESLGLLVEEQRINEIRNSFDMSGVVTGSPGTMPTGWSAQGNSNGWTRQIVGTGTIGDISYVDIRLSGTPTSSQFTISFQSPGVVAAAQSQSWSASLYYQLVGGSMSNITASPAANLWDSSSNFVGKINLIGSVTPTSTLQRFTGSGQINISTTAFINWEMTFTCTVGNTYDFTVRLAGPQLEIGSFSTSYIPTTGTAATRSEDVVGIAGTNFSSWYRQDEGTFYSAVHTNMFSGTPGLFLATASGDNNNSIQGILPEQSLVFSGGSLVANLLSGQFLPVVGAMYRVAFGVQVNNFARVANTSAIAVDTGGAMPTGINQIDIGGLGTGSSKLNGQISRFVYWPQRLPNYTLQAMTQ